MELRHLRYFLAVAEELHFGRAAARLHMTQQPLSRQIQALEADLGVQLFHRTKRRVELTGPGQWLCSEARRILTDVDQTIRTLHRIDQGEIGQLRLCFSPFTLYGLLPDLLKRFRHRYPEVDLSLQELCTEDQVEALRTGQRDLGLLHPPIRDPDLHLHPLPSEPFLLALPAHHPLAHQDPISLEQLKDESWILHPRAEGPVLYDQILGLFQTVGLSPRIVQQVTQPQTVLGLVSAGIGLALMPACLQNLKRAGVIYRSLQQPTPVLEFALAYRADLTSPLLIPFLSLLKEGTDPPADLEDPGSCPALTQESLRIREDLVSR